MPLDHFIAVRVELDHAPKRIAAIAHRVARLPVSLRPDLRELLAAVLLYRSGKARDIACRDAEMKDPAAPIFHLIRATLVRRINELEKLDPDLVRRYHVRLAHLSEPRTQHVARLSARGGRRRHRT